MKDRTRILAEQCRSRGGACPCVNVCAAMTAIDDELCEKSRARSALLAESRHLTNAKKRLKAKPATVDPNFVWGAPEGWRPVIVFDGDDAEAGYECDGEYEAYGSWPWDQTYIWWDDCERNGVHWEVA